MVTVRYSISTMDSKVPLGIVGQQFETPLVRGSHHRGHTLGQWKRASPEVSKKKTSTGPVARNPSDTSATSSEPSDSDMQMSLPLGISNAARVDFRRRRPKTAAELREERSQLVSEQQANFTPPKLQEVQETVLRFRAYYAETVKEHCAQSTRVHDILLSVYPTDCTVAVKEVVDDNTGILHGWTLGRGQHIETDFMLPGGPVRESDKIDFLSLFQIGSKMKVGPRWLTLVDADEFTRNYYGERVGYELGPSDALPAEDEAPYIGATMSSVRASKNSPLSGGKHFGGGRISVMDRAVDVQKTKQFQEHSRHVLRFYACFPPPPSVLPSEDVALNDPWKEWDPRHVAVLYYLADDTIEVREKPERNSGRDTMPVLFRRQRVPREDQTVSELTNDMYGGRDVPSTAYVDAEQLQTGAILRIFAHQFYVYGCDDYTRKHFAVMFGDQYVDNHLKSYQIDKPSAPLVRAKTPAWNGFGSPEDSRQNCKRVQPKPATKDFRTLLENDGKVLHFKARMIEDGVEDKDSEYVISAYPGDDTVAVSRSSSTTLPEGRYLKRLKAYKPDSGGTEVYTWRDFEVGKRVNIHKREFVVTEMDDRSAKFIRSQSHYMDGFRGALYKKDLSGILDKIRASIRTRYRSIADAFIDVDLDHNHELSYNEFRQMLKRLEIHCISGAEINDILLAFDENRDGHISFDEFMGMVENLPDYDVAVFEKRLELNQAAMQTMKQRNMHVNQFFA